MLLRGCLSVSFLPLFIWQPFIEHLLFSQLCALHWNQCLNGQACPPGIYRFMAETGPQQINQDQGLELNSHHALWREQARRKARYQQRPSSGKVVRKKLSGVEAWNRSWGKKFPYSGNHKWWVLNRKLVSGVQGNVREELEILCQALHDGSPFKARVAGTMMSQPPSPATAWSSQAEGASARETSSESLSFSPSVSYLQ